MVIAGVSAISSMILATADKPWLRTFKPMNRITHLSRSSSDVSEHFRREGVMFVHETEVSHTRRCELDATAQSFMLVLPLPGLGCPTKAQGES